MSKVFISYARDGSFGEKLAAQTQPQLQSAGYTVFRDVTDLNPGDRWDTKLEFELENSDLVVLIVSEKVRRSEWVHNEISMAKEIGLPIIPVLSEKIRMPLWLRHLQILDFSEQVEWEKLLRAINNQGVASSEKVTSPEPKVSKKIQSKLKQPENVVHNTSEKKEKALNEDEIYYTEFWPEFVRELRLDEPSQPMPSLKEPWKDNIFFRILPKTHYSWLTIRFDKKNSQVTVLLDFRKNTSQALYERLFSEKEEINKELGLDVEWTSVDRKNGVTIHKSFDDLFAGGNRDEIKEFFSDSVNRFVNTFRDRLKTIVGES